MEKFDYLTYERRNNQWIVHGWSTYPEDSVLAGQASKTFIDLFDEESELKEKYPEAEPSHPLLQPQINVNHLPDTGDD